MITLPQIEQSEAFSQMQPEDQEKIRTGYKKKYGEHKPTFDAIIGSETFSTLQPEQQNLIAENFDKKYGSNYGVQFIQESNLQRDGDFKGGIKQGLYQAKGLVGGLAGLAGDAIGSDTVRDYGFGVYKEGMDKAQQHGGSVHRVEDIKGFGDAVDWFQGMAGAQLPIIASMAVSGGVAGVVAKKALSTAAKKAVAKKVASGVTKEAAEKAVKSQIKKYATNIGIASSAGALESGGMWGEDAETQGVENANAGSAAGLGLISGLSETVSPVQRVASGLGFGKGGIVGKVLGEGSQELFQEFLGVSNEILNDPTKTTDDYFNDESVSRYLNSFAAGGVLGGGVGAVGSVLPNKTVESAQGVPSGVKPGNTVKEEQPQNINEQKPQPSNAPAPITPIEAKSGGSKDPSEMTDAEFAAYRRRQIAARR